MIDGCWNQTVPLYPAPALKGYSVGTNYAEQGFVFDKIPPEIYGKNCDKCNDLIIVTLKAGVTGINVSYKYIPGTLFWYLIKFTCISTVKNFEFTITINPKYSSYFTQNISIKGSIIMPISKPINLFTRGPTLTTTDFVPANANANVPPPVVISDPTESQLLRMFV